jgi:hypothetical protein
MDPSNASEAEQAAEVDGVKTYWNGTYWGVSPQMIILGDGTGNDGYEFIFQAATAGQPAGSVSVATFLADRTALDKQSPGGFAILDTAANIGANFNALEADKANIQSLYFSGTGTPVLKLTQAQVTADATLLARIKTAYDRDVAGAGNFQGVSYTSYEDAYTSAGFLGLATYYGATSTVVASESFTTNGGYSITVGGKLTQQKIVNADKSYDIRRYAVGTFQGVSYASYGDAYTSTGFLDLVTYYGATGTVVASESLTATGGYAVTVGGKLTQQKVVNADKSYNIRHYAAGTFQGVSYASYADAYTSVGFLDLVTYYGATGTVVASESLTATGGYAVTVGGKLTQQKIVNADKSYDISYTNITGKTYSSYENIYNAAGTKVAEAIANTNGTGSLFLYGNGLTVASSSTQESMKTGADVFALKPHYPTEAITATGANDDTFVFTADFGKDAISGFLATGATHDTLQFSASMFSYLTAGMTQAQDLAAVLAHATQTGGNTVISDTFGDALTLDAIAKTTLTANAGDFKFV